MSSGLFWASALTSVLVASAAQASGGESSKTGVFEFKLGGYTPLVDREPALNGAKPFASTFGSPNLLLGEIEYDRQFFQGFGSLGMGFSLGYAEKYAYAKLASSTLLSSERTSFQVVPMKLLAVYRFDVPALKWGIPVVPYAKGGLAYSGWWVNKGQSVEFFNGARGAGGTWGYAGILGISVLLDFFDMRLARDFDSGLGVNHSYLFAEYTHQEVNDFGRGGLDLSSRHWMFGLALEF